MNRAWTRELAKTCSPLHESSAAPAAAKGQRRSLGRCGPRRRRLVSVLDQRILELFRVLIIFAHYVRKDKQHDREGDEEAKHDTEGLEKMRI